MVFAFFFCCNFFCGKVWIFVYPWFRFNTSIITNVDSLDFKFQTLAIFAFPEKNNQRGELAHLTGGYGFWSA